MMFPLTLASILVSMFVLSPMPYLPFVLYWSLQYTCPCVYSRSVGEALRAVPVLC